MFRPAVPVESLAILLLSLRAARALKDVDVAASCTRGYLLALRAVLSCALSQLNPGKTISS